MSMENANIDDIILETGQLDDLIQSSHDTFMSIYIIRHMSSIFSTDNILIDMEIKNLLRLDNPNKANRSKMVSAILKSLEIKQEPIWYRLKRSGYSSIAIIIAMVSVLLEKKK